MPETRSSVGGNENGAVYFVRPGKRVVDPATEQVVLVERKDRFLRAVERFVVPSGALSHAVGFDGSVLEVTIAETGDRVCLYPRFRAVRLAPRSSPHDAGHTLATVLRDHLETQIPRLRQLIDEVFRDAVGLAIPASRLDAIATHESSGAREIDRRLQSKIGLEIEWSLEPEPRLASWLRRLQSLIPSTITQSFNEESRTAQFNLSYTARVVRALPSRLHLVQRRAEAGLGPEAELASILQRVFVVLNPAFGLVGSGAQIWRLRNFWQMVELAFEDIVAPAIAEDFGYEVAFQDFRRESTPAERDVLQLLEDPQRLTREFETAERLFIAALEREREIIEQNDYEMTSEFVVRIRDNVRLARERMEEAKVAMETASRGRPTDLGNENSERARQLLKAFHDQLRLGHPELIQVEAQPSPSGSAE